MPDEQSNQEHPAQQEGTQAVPVPASPKRPSYDWTTLKAQFLQFEGTPADFFRQSGLKSEHNFYRQIKRQKWVAERDALKRRALQPLLRSTEAALRSKWKKQLALWGQVEDMASMMLQAGIKVDKKDGKEVVTLNMTASELSNLTSAIQNALRGQRLVLGESTDNVASHNIHEDLVRVVNEVENPAGAAPGAMVTESMIEEAIDVGDSAGPAAATGSATAQPL